MTNVKPRYDGSGSEFGLVHRKLPIKCGMFDIDRMSAQATIDLELKKQDVGFFEYRTNWKDNSINWKALFEVKYKDSHYVQEAIKCKIGTSTWAQLKLCETLGARYFIVVSTFGKQPFTFYEIDILGCSRIVGTLDYNDRNTDGAVNINKFWNDILKL